MISKAAREERQIYEVGFRVNSQVSGKYLDRCLDRSSGPPELGPVASGAQSVDVKRLLASLPPPHDAEIEVL